MNKLSRYRKLRYKSVFESENQSSRLNVIGNPLERLSSLVDFEIFRPTLEALCSQASVRAMPGVLP